MPRLCPGGDRARHGAHRRRGPDLPARGEAHEPGGDARTYFDQCVEWEVVRCKRVSNQRAKCVGRVTWQDQSGVNACRVVNRFEQERGEIKIYKISKPWHPA